MSESNTLPEIAVRTLGSPVPRFDPKQVEYLLKRIRGTRIAGRQQSGKTLSYLESWDVRAHLDRVFGYGMWDAELLDYGLVHIREYESSNGSDMVEPIWRARVQLTVRNPDGIQVCRYTEAAVGSASAPANMISEAHDNALKAAESDAFKRCCINLGDQFGLSLYNGGSKDPVVVNMVVPDRFGVTLDGAQEAPVVTPEQEAILAESLGARPVEEGQA